MATELELDTFSWVHPGNRFQSGGPNAATTQAADRLPVLEFYQSVIEWTAGITVWALAIMTTEVAPATECED